jgi:hypothetical protein
MWPFRRKAETSPATGGPQPAPGPVIRRDWMGLPAIQRLIGDHPLTAPSDRFSDDLATHHDPSISADAMGHQVSAEAPAGIVLALVRPSTRSDGPAMIPRPRVQRRADGAVAESGEWDGDQAASVETRPSPLPASAPAIAAHELPVVAAEPAAQRLVSLPPDAAPIPVPATPNRSRTISTPTLINEPSETPPAPRLTLGQSRRLGLGPPIKRVPDRSVQRTAVDAMPAAAPYPHPDAEGAAAQALPPMPAAPPPWAALAATTERVLPSAPLDPTAQSARRVPGANETPRLDLPLAHRPAVDAPAAQRTASVGDGGAPLTAPSVPVETTVTASPNPLGDPSTLAPAAVQRLVEESPLPGLASESRQTRTSDTRTTPAVSSLRLPTLPLVSDSRTRPAAQPAAPGPEIATIAPLVSARPLRPTVGVQRSTDAAPSMRENSTVHTLRPEPAGAPNSDPERAPTAGWFVASTFPNDASAFPEDESPAMPLAPAPLGHGQADLALADETEPVVQAYRPGSSLPLAPPPGMALQRAAQALADSRTEPADESGEPFAPTLQGAWYDSIAAGATRMASSAMSSGAAVGGGALGSAAGAAASSLGHQQAAEPDMDELAGKLYDRIRTRLRTELLIDRERAGFLTDLR